MMTTGSDGETWRSRPRCAPAGVDAEVERPAPGHHPAPPHVLGERGHRQLLRDLGLADERPAAVTPDEQSLAHELVERGANRQPRHAEIDGQLALRRDRLADAELLDQVEDAVPHLALLRHRLRRFAVRHRVRSCPIQFEASYGSCAVVKTILAERLSVAPAAVALASTGSAAQRRRRREEVEPRRIDGELASGRPGARRRASVDSRREQRRLGREQRRLVLAPSHRSRPRAATRRPGSRRGSRRRAPRARRP